jgi:predicted aspartyl protease
MGAFYAKCKIENPTDRSRSVVIPKLLLDTGSEFTWALERMLERIGIRREKKDVRFVLANGQEVTRSVGFAIIRLDKYFTIDEVVFAEPGDLALLGARTLEGLNLTVDPVRRRLVDSGPLPAASPTRSKPTSRLRRFNRRAQGRLARPSVHRLRKPSVTPILEPFSQHRQPHSLCDCCFRPILLGSSARFCSHSDLRETQWHCRRVSSGPALSPP